MTMKINYFPRKGKKKKISYFLEWNLYISIIITIFFRNFQVIFSHLNRGLIINLINNNYVFNSFKLSNTSLEHFLY